MKVLEPDDETILIPIRKDQHRVTFQDETESKVTIVITPIEKPEKRKPE